MQLKHVETSLHERQMQWRHKKQKRMTIVANNAKSIEGFRNLIEQRGDYKAELNHKKSFMSNTKEFDFKFCRDLE